MFRTACLVLTLLCLVAPAAGRQDDAPPFDRAALLDAGAKTVSRIRSAARWSLLLGPDTTPYATAELVQATGRVRIDIRVVDGSAKHAVATIILRDGSWFVREREGIDGRYRPFEAPFCFMGAYQWITHVLDPLVVADVTSLGTYENTIDGEAVFRTPLPPESATQFRSLLEGLARQEQLESRPDIVATRKQLQAALDDGMETRVDVATGVIVQSGLGKHMVRIVGFEWLDDVDPALFEVGDRTWANHTADPTAGNRADLLMVSHDGSWRSGTKDYDPEGRLLNLATDDLRRLPFAGRFVTGGSFSHDRRRAVVTGMDVDGGLSIHEIDLRTRATRVVGADAFDGSFPIAPRHSADGRSVAVWRLSPSRLQTHELIIVDLVTDETRRIGDPIDGASHSWLPDGSGFVIEARVVDEGDPRGARTRFVARLDMDGTLTRLVEGSSPVLLNDGKTILYQDPERQWFRCDLDGGHAAIVADGLPGCGFPTAGPRDDEIIMIHFEGGRGPRPIRVDLRTGEKTMITDAPGLWASPCWR